MSRTVNQLHARLERLEVLYKISNIVNTTLDPREVLRLLLKEVVRITNATSGSIAMVDRKKGVLNIETAINIHPRLWKNLRLELGVGVTGFVAWTGKPLRVEDVQKDPRYVCLKNDIKSEMALPLIIEGNVIGVINVDSTRAGAFTGDDEDLCMAVANQSAKVIETARLHAAIKRQAEEMDSLFKVGRTLIMPGPLEQILDRIVEAGNSLLKGRACVLFEVTEEQTLRPWAISGGTEISRDGPNVRISQSLLGRVAKRAVPIRVLDVQSEPKFFFKELAERDGLVSLAAVPVAYQDSVLAVLALFSGEQRRFRESEIRLLQLLANQGAIAIENARRMERLTILEASVRQSERLSLLGTLAAEMAHEIRNPITIINLLLHSIHEDPTQNEQTRNDVRIVTEKLERINQIIEQTLSLARSSESEFRPGNLNKLVEELLLFLGYKLTKAGVEVECNLDPKIPDIQMDPGQIQQVLLNLMINAMEAMTDVKKPRLRIRTRTGSDRGIGPCVKFTVEDNGRGITPASLKSLFDAFYTTQEKGTGLGLFISNKLVRRHQGRIQVKSTPDEGSIFTVSLPVATEVANT
ncbi:MAG: GAF domain-containing protein [Candidatus Sumerlaeia bacterium]|nr:GAF domain-containing protein [Candidatus Sumerlaeia bacterium]